MQQYREAQQEGHGRRTLVPGRRELVSLFERRLAPVTADNDGEQLLFLARESGHVGVGE